MSNNHIITREIGNLRGFSTDSLYLRPSNVAETATNIQRAPDGTLQLRRGYQCQIADIGGMGIGTFDDPAVNDIRTVCVSTDGFVYNKLTKQIYFYYNGLVSGAITGITNANPAVVTSNNHGLTTNTFITLSGIGGMTELNFKQYIVGATTLNEFQLLNLDLTPVDTTNIIDFPPYTSGGTWIISFTQARYLTFSIYVDPQLIYNGSGQSINCKIIENRSGQTRFPATLTNVIPLYRGHDITAGSIVQFYDNLGVLKQRNVLSVIANSMTIDGDPVSVLANMPVNLYFNFMFGKGFDVVPPYLISQFLTALAAVPNLLVAINGDTNLPAAFLQIVEPIVINSSLPFTINYWYWQKVNFTINPPLPGSANIKYQNSPDFENASMAVFDDVIFICNGWDYPQKYDGQTVYRAGMPIGARPTAVDGSSISAPFNTGEVYQYAITYEQVDAKGHIVEGEISEIFSYEVQSGPTASQVTVNNLISTAKANWNTNFALTTAATASVYGPYTDPKGNVYYFDLISLHTGFTIKIGDTAYYGDGNAGTSSSSVTNSFVIPLVSGHVIEPGDLVVFIDTSFVTYYRLVVSTTPTSMNIQGVPVTIPNATTFIAFKTGLVFGDVAIINGSQSNINTIIVFSGHSVLVNDIVEFIDSQDNLQRRNVTGVSSTSITIDGISVSVISGVLISSINQRNNAINILRVNDVPVQFLDNDRISNNLRINVYRTKKNESFNVNGEIYLVKTLVNDGSGTGTQSFFDLLTDDEVQRSYDNPIEIPTPPPISKYVKAFGNQLFYAGGERGNPDNSDNVFFSEGNAPENVPLATNFFSVPNVDDDITGIGVSGSTLITTKNHSLWATTGNFLTGQIEVVQIAQGTNIGCVANASIASVGTLMYFLHTNGVYAITENQLFPTDAFGNPIPVSLAIDVLFRQTNYLPWTKYVLKRAVAVNYTKDNQYLLFLPCEDSQTTIRTANINSIILCYDYQGKNWFTWDNMNAAGGIFVIDDELYFQERRFSRVDGNTANLYKQHRFYRLVDHADHAGAQICEWVSSWEDLGQPEVRKKFCRCVLLLDRLSELLQYNNPQIEFSSYLNRLPNLKNTIVTLTQTDNIRNSSWSISGWGWNFWSGYQDSFITINLKQGTVAKSIQVGFTIKGINMDIKLAGFQLEAIPENRKSVLR